MTVTTLQLGLSYAMQAAMAIGAAIFLWQQQYTAAGLTLGALAISFIPALLKKPFGIHTPPPFLLFLVIFVFGSLFLGEAHGLYRFFWWWDMALHLASGFLLGIVGFLLVYVLNGVAETGERMRPGFVSFFTFCFAVTIGAFWEVLEFVLDIFFTLKMQTEKAASESKIADSMLDLIMDALGALVTMFIVYWHLKHKERACFLGRWVGQFIHNNPQLCAKDAPRR